MTPYGLAVRFVTGPHRSQQTSRIPMYDHRHKFKFGSDLKCDSGQVSDDLKADLHCLLSLFHGTNSITSVPEAPNTPVDQLSEALSA